MIDLPHILVDFSCCFNSREGFHVDKLCDELYLPGKYIILKLCPKFSFKPYQWFRNRNTSTNRLRAEYKLRQIPLNPRIVFINTFVVMWYDVILCVVAWYHKMRVRRHPSSYFGTKRSYSPWPCIFDRVKAGYQAVIFK